MSVFIHVEGRRRRQSQWAIWVLVCLCVLSFVWFSLCPPARQLQWVTQWGVVPADVLDRHQPWFRQLADPALLRLLTGLFIHVTWLHLLSNMLFLVIFGVPTDRTLGSARFMLLFLLGGAASNLCGAISLEGYRAPIIGCSGAVSAVVGTYIALFPRARMGLVLPLGLYFEFVRLPAWMLIGIWVLIQLIFSYIGASYGAVAWWTHISGFLFGVMFALLARDGIARRRRR